MSERNFEALSDDDNEGSVEGSRGGTAFSGEFGERTKSDAAFGGEFGERDDEGRDNESREALPNDVPID
jgi:hypothetical protein